MDSRRKRYLSERRNQTELLQEAELIGILQLLDDFAICHANNITSRQCYLFTSGRILALSSSSDIAHSLFLYGTLLA